MTKLHNQHVVAFKNEVKTMWYASVYAFRDPHGNIASPTRAMYKFACDELTYEIVRSVSGEAFLKLPLLVKPV